MENNKTFAIVDENLVKILNKIQIPVNIDIKDNVSVLVADKDVIDVVKNILESKGKDITLALLRELQNGNIKRHKEFNI